MVEGLTYFTLQSSLGHQAFPKAIFETQSLKKHTCMENRKEYMHGK